MWDTIAESILAPISLHVLLMKDCYFLFNNSGNCLSVFECDNTKIDSDVADNMIYTYSEFLDLED